MRCKTENCSRLIKRPGATTCHWHTPTGELCHNPECMRPLIGKQARFCRKDCQFACNPGRPQTGQMSRMTVQLDPETMDAVAELAHASNTKIQKLVRQIIRDGVRESAGRNIDSPPSGDTLA